jgi:hypothetical protein
MGATTVGVLELLAATTTITPRTSATTTTVVQAVGGQGGNSSRDVWVPLLAALLGAIVGGLLALYGSILVNRWELRRKARFRMYEELLPRIKNETWPRFRSRNVNRDAFEMSVDRDAFEQSLDALERAGAIAGPREWIGASWVKIQAGIYIFDAFSEAPESSDPSALDEKAKLMRKLRAKAKDIDDAITQLDQFLQSHVRRLWPRMEPDWWQRLTPRRKKTPA